MKLHRVLIANRGEIAVRIIRSCRELGIETVLAASEADLDAVPAQLADRVICIGPAPAAQSYLNPTAIVEAAVSAKAQAIHPGYGFLSENPRLARRCEAAGIVFVGPTQEQLANVGDKLRARELAIAAGLPVVPGGAVADTGAAYRLAAQIGFPVLIKAVGGGGGRGMKRVYAADELPAQVDLAMAEADAAFADARVYLERYVECGRHVEVQLLGDGEHVIHLGDRDCSVQRRFQKLIEEAPAPLLDPDLRARMLAGAVALGRHLGYRGAGTVEFLVDCAHNEFWFLEMNARIQVEHPVTEAITGIDIVAAQIAIAEGRGLALAQHDVRSAGHAIECRINAEDAARNFQPSPGTVADAWFPAGPAIRVDTHIEPGARVPPFYDSLLAKIIVTGADRAAALDRMQAALAQCHVNGIATNTQMHRQIMAAPEFAAGGVDTGFFARFMQPRAAA